MSAILNSLRELAAKLTRSSRAKRQFPHVFFGHNVAVGTHCQFGSNVRIYSEASLSSVSVGDFSYVGGGSKIKHATIGKFCSIGPNVNIGLGLHPTDYVSTYPGFYSTSASGSVPFVERTTFQEQLDVEIGNDVWIGAHALIMDNVLIGDGAIVGAGAVVTKNVAPYAIVAGVPARELKKRFDENLIAFLLEFSWWDKDEDFIRSNASLFKSPDVFHQRFSQ